uniref:Uncharacterized protein n=1 Tax=Anguilla anguilla TaxID=7936 RepID=A0A0E9SYI3_ANGAN
MKWLLLKRAKHIFLTLVLKKCSLIGNTTSIFSPVPKCNSFYWMLL